MIINETKNPYFLSRNKAFKLEGDTKGESRNRVLSDSELETLLDKIRNNRFNLFVRFAYYTGARSGEIHSILGENIFSNHIIFCKKMF